MPQHIPDSAKRLPRRIVAFRNDDALTKAKAGENCQHIHTADKAQHGVSTARADSGPHGADPRSIGDETGKRIGRNRASVNDNATDAGVELEDVSLRG